MTFRGKLSAWVGNIARVSGTRITVLVLDTNHVSELGYGTPSGVRLCERLMASREETATTIVTVEEQLRGWLAEIHRLTSPHLQIRAYQ